MMEPAGMKKGFHFMYLSMYLQYKTLLCDEGYYNELTLDLCVPLALMHVGCDYFLPPSVLLRSKLKKMSKC